jgi:hypothetical protein
MNDATIDEILQQFARLLEDRFSKQVYTTEDSIRCTLSYCLTTYGEIHPSDVIFEYPHPLIPGAEVDTYIPQRSERTGLVFELNFDREIPSGRNLPRTQRAGKVFADIFRLALFEPDNINLRRYFIYVTDKEMATYFQNPSNQLNDFFNQMPGEILKIDRNYTEKHPNSFIKAIGNDIIDCKVVCCLNRDFESEIWVRVYEIEPTNFR